MKFLKSGLRKSRRDRKRRCKLIFRYIKYKRMSIEKQIEVVRAHAKVG